MSESAFKQSWAMSNNIRKVEILMVLHLILFLFFALCALNKLPPCVQSVAPSGGLNKREYKDCKHKHIVSKLNRQSVHKHVHKTKHANDYVVSLPTADCDQPDLDAVMICSFVFWLIFIKMRQSL